MSSQPETVNITIKRIELRNVSLEGLGPLDVAALAKEIEKKMEEISKERNMHDTYKLALYAALFYAGKVYSKNGQNEKKDRADEKQLDAAIDKLTFALNRLPLN